MATGGTGEGLGLSNCLLLIFMVLGVLVQRHEQLTSIRSRGTELVKG